MATHDNGFFRQTIFVCFASISLSCSASEPSNSRIATDTSNIEQIIGTDIADILEGTPKAEKLVGLAGDDFLGGAGGADIFVGGKGEDLLFGGADSDTYVFGKGDGPDIVEDAGGDNDRFVFTDGVNADDIVIKEQAAGIRVSWPDSGISILIVDWGNEKNRIERFVFSNKELSAAQIESRISGNRRPRVSKTVAPQVAKVGEHFELTLPAETFSDPDRGDALKFAFEPSGASHIPEWLVVDYDDMVLSGTPGTDDIGQIAIKFIATDQGYLEAVVELYISVAE